MSAKVLVVEDQPEIAMLIAETLRSESYDVAVAANGAEAIDHLRRERPRAIVLDLMMPVMHGWEFMETYAAATDGNVIPIVVVSARPEVPASYQRFGLRRTIAKPFDVDDLLQSVRDAVDGATLMDVHQCAWCLAVKDSSGVYGPPATSKLRYATHGICPSCARAFLGELTATTPESRPRQV